MTRWLRFLFAILAGASLGLLYGWVIDPVQYIDTTIDTLRFDYKTDYVLMVAEAHSVDKDLDQTLGRLSTLSELPPERIVREAILNAEELGYADVDIARMLTLLDSILAAQPVSESTSP